jgi:hypothetical protein
MKLTECQGERYQDCASVRLRYESRETSLEDEMEALHRGNETHQHAGIVDRWVFNFVDIHQRGRHGI